MSASLLHRYGEITARATTAQLRAELREREVGMIAHGYSTSAQAMLAMTDDELRSCDTADLAGVTLAMALRLNSLTRPS